MCITTKPSIMSNTLIYTGSGTYKNKYVHVIAYQNTATNVSNEPNAMIIPFPTSQPMTQDNIIDTSKFKHFLKDIAEASKIQSFSLNSDMLGSRSFSKALVFESGSYTVVLANDISEVPEALQLVPAHKRPTISSLFLENYSELYPKQPIAICCWESKVKAEPLLWWYEPTDKDTLFVPTMDSHDGNAPDKKAWVDTDHVISIGSSTQTVGNAVNYTDFIPEDIISLLPLRTFGTKLKSKIINGDMWASSNLLPYSLSSLPELTRGDFLTKESQNTTFIMNGWE